MLLIIVVRTIILALVVIGLNQVETLGTHPAILVGSVFLGTILASALACTTLTHRGFALVGVALVVIFWSCSIAAAYIPIQTTLLVLSPYSITLHGELILICIMVSATSTWCFWRIRETPTFELLIMLAGCILALSGHREFRLDSPKALSTIAWSLGIDQVYMFSAIGLLIAVLTLVYLSLASLPIRQKIQRQWSIPLTTLGKRSILLSTTGVLLLLGIFIATFYFTYGHYHRISTARLGNGVGENSQEGLSPLGFHSALGSTNQPAALVRLEGDYRENPFTPMLYLRENALSTFNGHEMVIASAAFDTDVAGTSPNEPYDGKEDSDLTARVPISHSVYLLADHKIAMAIDYPISIRPLKNPNPAKFKGSYRAYSVVPGFSKEMIREASVGDPRWDTATREHYLQTHGDTRYQELALSIASSESAPIPKALALTQFLSKKSIYTLTPNHTVAKDADQTAPYLFGDLRGYCVHFAHAMVYMLRSLGIPARIGTGYLTDLSQAKDGHILLRMSDRHAWAEIYLTDYGWVPFDIQPEQVENHADTKVDLKLLEDLMGLLDPGEEILPKDLEKNEPSFESEWQWSLSLPWRKYLFGLTILLLTCTVVVKVLMRYSWILTQNPYKRIRASYIALACRLAEIGYSRLPGETRSEYRERLRIELGFDVLPMVDSLTRSVYQSTKASSLSTTEIDRLRNAGLSQFSNLPWYSRFIAALNPISVKRFLFPGGW